MAGSQSIGGAGNYLRKLAMGLTTTLQRITEVNPGMKMSDAVTSDRLNSIRDALNALANGENINQGAGTFLKRGGGSVTISADIGGRSTGTPPAPFSLYSAGNGKVGVRFGMVTCYRRASGLKPWPGDFSATSNPPFTYEFDGSGGGVAWIKVENDTDGAYNKVKAISMGHGSQIPDEDEENGYLSLGAWSAVEGAITVYGAGVGHQFYNFCGEAHFWGPA
jgi:hypothetical protein